MPTLPSFTRYYWAAWIAALIVWLLSSLRMPLAEGLGWFALVVGLGSVYVFHFEFGRLMGFLRVHCPVQHAELQAKPFIEAVAFVHQSILSRSWLSSHSPHQVHESAFRVYRSAWLFSLLTLVALLVLANTVQ